MSWIRGIFKKINNLIVDVFYIFASVFILLFLLEIFAKDIEAFFINSKKDNTRYDVDLFLKMAYEGQNIKEVKEMLSEVWSPKISFESLLDFHEKEFTGKYVNVSKIGYRLIEDQVLEFDKNNTNIFVFGGSTTFGYGVSDIETIPSYLQKFLRDNLECTKDRKIAVYNFGAAYYYSSQELAKFKKLIMEGFVPDVAIFIDGLNDFATYGKTDSTILADCLERKTTSSIKEYVIYGLVSKSNLINAIINISEYFNIRNPLSSFKCGTSKYREASNEEIDFVVNRLLVNQMILDAIGKTFKVKTVFVLQPVSSYKFDEKNRRGLFEYSEFNILVNKNVSRAYERYLDLIKNPQNDLKIELLDLHWFNNFDFIQYVDAVHYSPKFNQKIAESIGSYLCKKDFID